MLLRQLIFKNNDCYKAGRIITPKGIMVHSTGANNPTLRRYVGPDDGPLGKNANNNHWNVGGLAVCVHAFIGKLADGRIATYQTLPWNHRGWHCGGDGNNTHISFEICEDGLTDPAYFQAVWREAAELCAMLCLEYKLKPASVICHSEGAAKGIASSHADVMHWFPRHGKTMADFRAAVALEMEGEDVKIEEIAIANLDTGKDVTVSAVNIGGKHYVELRDLEALAPVTIGNVGKKPTIKLNYN